MPEYRVEVPEIHYQTMRVEADSPEAAARAVAEGDGEAEGALRYSATYEDGRFFVRDSAGSLVGALVEDQYYPEGPMSQ